jgi:glycosyltransferase involved in cell wall biosynthesis
LEQHSGIAFESVRDDDPAEMAGAVLALLANPKRAAELGNAGFAVAEAWNRQQLAALVKVLSSTA